MMTVRIGGLGSLLLLLAACSSADDGASATSQQVALVSLATAQSGPIAHRLTLYGAAEAGPGSKFAIVAPAEGTVIAIAAAPGTIVTRGQVIARLAPTAQTRLDLAKAGNDAGVANAALARAQRLRADGLGSAAEVETARAAARSANLVRASLQDRAGALVIRAPVGGVIDAVTPSPGDIVQTGGVVASITRPATMQLRFGVDPAAASELSIGEAMQVTVTGGAPIVVPIEAIAPVVDPQTRLIAIFARLAPNSGVTAGQTLSATVTTGGSGRAVIAVPYAALLDDAGQPYVFVVTGTIAHRRDVTVGATTGDRVAITAGLRGGEQIVVQGGTAVEDGMKVRVR